MKLENEKKNYYLGLDIGTNSVGAAAADENYDPMKHKGEPIWVSHLFDEGKQCSERRGFRTARRRLDRRQQRVQLIDEIFAPEVAKVDEGFYIRKQESALWREDKTNPSQVNMYFNDKGYTDTDYHREYPTIHHLIMKLMEEEGPFDIRMVNIAVDWLVAHRGHFLSEIRVENVDKITDFSTVYEGFIDYLDTEGLLEDYYAWEDADREALEKLFKQKSGITAKKKGLKEIVYGAKIPKNEELPYKPDSMVNFLAGGKIKAKDLFQGSEYEDDFSFSISDDMEEILPKLGDDADFVSRMIAIYVTNREGHAAKVYFNALFGKKFSRDDEENVTNAALNYGYSLILSAVNREVSANGYLTQLGLWHDNQFNHFNLSCDIMEPVRIVVDEFVYKHEFQTFETEEKHLLASILNESVHINHTEQNLLNAVKIYVKSIFDALNKDRLEEIHFIEI